MLAVPSDGIWNGVELLKVMHVSWPKLRTRSLNTTEPQPALLYRNLQKLSLKSSPKDHALERLR